MKSEYLYKANNCNMKPKGSGFLTICCNNCGRRLEMYYRPWCPVCEPPKQYTKDKKKVWNLIQIRTYLRIVDEEYNKIDKSVWDALYREYSFSNDSFIDYFPGSIFHNYDDLKTFDSFLFKYFKINKSLTFWVSW